MILSLNDLTLIIKFDNPKEERLIKKFITFKDDKRAFFGGSFHPEAVKDVCLGKAVREYFVCFAGLAREIIIFAKQNNIPITEFNDNRTHFPFQKKEWSHEQLRKYFNPNFTYVEHQIRALQAMINTNTGIIVAPTSAGKSSIMSAYIRLINLPTLILVNKVMLGSQLRKDFINDGIDCGLCSGKGVIDGKCMVSTIQSVKKLGDLTKFKCILIDEVHNASASQFQDFLKQFGCALKFGFSASPYRTGDYLGYAKIRQFVGSPIIKIESKELLDNNVMAKPHLYLVRNICKEDDYFDYQTAYMEEVVNGSRRNNIVKDIVDVYKSGVLVLVNMVEHGEMLQNLIPNSVFISGDTPIDDRLLAVKKFDEGELPVLIGTTILQEGISITHMKAMVLACGGKSNVAVLQKIGRSLRFKEGEKTDVDFYDFVDSAKFLSRHSKLRINLYKKAGYDDIKLLNSDLSPIDKNK
jgi:superfamily II DNA or RNA helicase